MHLLKSSTASAVLRVGTLICLATIFLAATSVGVLQGTFSTNGTTKVIAQDGYMDLRGSDFQHTTVYLNGMWEYHPNVFELGESFDPRLLAQTQMQWAVLPLDSAPQSIGPGSYRLLLRTDYDISAYAFYLEHYDEDFSIYVNGKRITPVAHGIQRTLIASLSHYLFPINGLATSGEIEIVISANSSRNQALLYRNAIVFGPVDSVVDYVALVWRDNTFLIGMILIMVTIGLVFALMRARFDMLTSITMFDTLLAIRILLGYSVVTYFIHHFMPHLNLDRVDFVGLQYVVFFFCGAFGCLLSRSIFDCEHRLPMWPIWVQIGICATGGLFTLLFYRYMPTLCIAFLFITLVVSFAIVTWHVWHLVQEDQLNAYKIFQLIKTYYIGGMMALDILYFRGMSYNAMIYGYLIFLFAHLAARIIDSNTSYKKVETLNRDQEKIIAARTSELTEMNRCLSELSVRDPLTQAYNRLYFEESMTQALQEHSNESIYLCMFDLDYFKSINDRFGHVSGDDQLKFVVTAVNQILGEQGTLSRIGGEEFAILFAGASKSHVLELLEEIRQCFAADAKSNSKRTTASFGLVQFSQGMSPKDVMRAADKCLYSAKKLGRNCLVME